MQHQGIMGSIFVAMLIVLNASMQILLCSLINASVTMADIDDSTVEDMKLWRTYSGHSWDYVDKLSFEPLARRICRGDQSVPMSSSVIEILDNINAYMPTDELYEQQVPFLGHWLPHISFMPRGQLMCIVVLIVWVTNVVMPFQK